jgi:hypothetical protein
MKTTEFLKENSIIAQEADTMHKDHEVQMARSQMYNSANAAIEIHKLLKNISEMEGIEGWVASKLTLANQYLESVRDYLKYEQVDQQSEMMEFVGEAADYALDTLLAEDDYDDAVAAFLSKNKPVQGKTHKPRQSERLGGSRHIGGGKEKMKASRTGIGSKPTGKAVAGQASLGEEGYKDWSEKNPGELNKQTADMYDRNTHRWGGDTGVPGAKEHGGKDELKTVDRSGNPVTNRATRIEKPEGVPKVSKKPMTSFGGGGSGGTVSDTRDLQLGSELDPKVMMQRSGMRESKQGMSRAAKGHEKYGKAGMQALAKAGREGASEKELDAIRDKHDNYNKNMKQGVAKGLNEFAPGSGGGESGRWYTDDQMTDIVGDGWWQDMDVSGANIGVPDGDVPKQYMIQQAQAWLDDQGYSVQVLNCKLNDDDMEWFIEGNFRNPGFAKKGVAEARNGDTNFGSTVGHGSWVVYDGGKVKRFKSRDGAKAYAEKNGGKVASSEHYADNIQSKQAVKENASAGASSAGGVAVSIGGPGHKPTSGVPKKIGNAHKTKKVAVGKGIY